MKAFSKTSLLLLFLVLTVNTTLGQNQSITELGADIMFTIFKTSNDGPHIALLIQKKDGSEVSLEEFSTFTYQEKPGIPEGFKKLNLEPGDYTFDNFYQNANFTSSYGDSGIFTLFIHPTTIVYQVKNSQVISKSWSEYSETDFKMESETYFDNGNISATGLRNKEGYKIGEWKHFDQEGHLTMSGTYENDNRIGVWKEYDINGSIKNEVNFSKKNTSNSFEYFSKKQ